MLWRLLLISQVALAHDAPADVTVHLQMRGADVLVRIPLAAVRDVEFPQTAGGYLDTVKVEPKLPALAKLWAAEKVAMPGVGPPRVEAVNLAIEADRSFASFEEALRHVRAPLPASGENVFWKQAWFDIHLVFPAAGESIHPNFVDLGEKVTTVLHTPARTFLLEGDPGVVDLNPSWWRAAARFAAMGFEHILSGADHLLFLLCLVIANRRLRDLVWIVSAFTLAHSITLLASALGWTPAGLWFPPLVELAIAVSIVYMAAANVLDAAPHGAGLAFGFGLVHGFGFSFALRESLQFAGDHLPAALLAFNIGVELGQLAALGIAVPLLRWACRAFDARLLAVVLSAFVAHTGWHWTLERWDTFRKFQVTMDAATAALLLKWAVAGMAAWGLLWLARRRMAK